MAAKDIAVKKYVVKLSAAEREQLDSLIASSLFGVGSYIRPLLHQTAPPTWLVFLGSADRGIAVGTRVTPRPPHRTVRAAFPHKMWCTTFDA